MQDTPYPAFSFLKIVRILHRLVIGIFHKACVASKRICHNDRLFFLLFHMITSRITLSGRQKMMIAFFLQPW